MKEGSSLFILPGNPQFGRNRFEEIQGKKELKYNNNSFPNRIRYNFDKNNSWKRILRYSFLWIRNRRTFRSIKKESARVISKDCINVINAGHPVDRFLRVGIVVVVAHSRILGSIKYPTGFTFLSSRRFLSKRFLSSSIIDQKTVHYARSINILVLVAPSSMYIYIYIFLSTKRKKKS